MSTREDRRKIGEYLVETGALRKEQIGPLLDEQRTNWGIGLQSRLGEIAVRKGWSDADQVTSALRRQTQQVIDHTDAGEILLTLGWVSAMQVAEARLRCERSSEMLQEAIAELGFCDPERLRIAEIFASLRTATAMRLLTESSFSPYNIMELIVGEEAGNAIRSDGMCACSQCWSNVFALALNGTPPRYVSDHGRILESYKRFRQDYGDAVRQKVASALAQVRSNPKASCWSRFSDEILAGREADDRVQEVDVRVSPRHVHLTRQNVESLFGPGAMLTPLKELAQPGQFTAQETVSLLGPKGTIEKVRILGPLRNRAQVEISGTDQFILGLQVPVRESGVLEQTPGITLKGPRGELKLEDGCIRAMRHIHMPPADADRIGVKDGSRVSVRLLGDRATIVENVVVRVGPASVLEMHIDTDEANAAGATAESRAQILIPMMAV